MRREDKKQGKEDKNRFLAKCNLSGTPGAGMCQNVTAPSHVLDAEVWARSFRACYVESVAVSANLNTCFTIRPVLIIGGSRYLIWVL
jgi:hypothetical protein